MLSPSNDDENARYKAVRNERLTVLLLTSLPVDQFGSTLARRHRECNEAIQGRASPEDVALLDCFAALAKTPAASRTIQPEAGLHWKARELLKDLR